MTKKQLFLVFLAALFLLSLSLALLWLLLPDSIFADERSRTLASFVTSLIAAAATGYLGYNFTRFTARPILRIEHLDIKSERIPFSIDENLWWYIDRGRIHERLSQAIQRALGKNEFQYFHLRELEEAADTLAKGYIATSAWTRNLLGLLSEFRQNTSPDRREQLVAQLNPSVARFEDHYLEVRKRSLFGDLQDHPEEACQFLEAEIAGLLARHEREQGQYKALLTWIEGSLKGGENRSKTIDHHSRRVPTVYVFVGLVNIGETPALVRAESHLLFENIRLPLRLRETAATLGYYLIEARGAGALSFEIDKDGCSFDDQVTFYEALTRGQDHKKVSVCLNLADGTKIKSATLRLVDDASLRV